MTATGLRATWVTLQRVTFTDDGQGGSVQTWVDVGREAAQIEPLSVREIQQAGAMAATLTTALTIPYRPDVSAKDRIVVDDGRGLVRVLQVENVENDPVTQSPPRQETRVLCSELEA